MTVVLNIAKRSHNSHAQVVQIRPSSLVDRIAAALRRGADQRFSEQLDRIERTGHAGAF